MSKSLAKSLLAIALRESYVRSFGKYFLTSISSIDINSLPKKVTYDYIVPPSMCRKYPNIEKPICSTAAILSLFDELSSQSLIIKDSLHRPGVSIHLDTQMTQPIHSGDKLVVVTKADKIGKSVGFSSVEIHKVVEGEPSNSERTLVAKGKHIKYMPMGLAWSIIFHSLFINFTLWIYNTFRRDKFKTPIDHLFNEYWNKKDAPTKLSDEEKKISNLFDSLDVQPAKDGEYKVKVKSHMKNMLGMLHGGALATSIDQSLYLHYKKIIEGDKVPIYVDDIDIRYLTSMKGEVSIFVEDDLDSYHIPGTNVYLRSIGKVVDSKNRVCAEFTAHWRLY